MHTVDAATQALQRGEIVLLYDADGREEETDMVVLGRHCSPETLRTLRTDAGGLVCTAIAPEFHQALDLPFLSDLIQGATAKHPSLAGLLPDDIAYDGSKPAFGLTINHRDTFTGITDRDRSLTMMALEEFLGQIDATDMEAARVAFGRQFRSPGHVSLLNGAPGGLGSRLGHTELSLELARLAGATPVTTVCEMLDPQTGMALSRAAAQAYAAEHGLVFLTGSDVIRAWRETTTAPVSVPTSA
jgi:3,4-dihydroxy 2-butanone 4-phosphate synthase